MESYKDGMKLAGLIYLHDITQDRFSGSIKKNLEMFRYLCGEAAISRVFLVTSKWSRMIDLNQGKEHQCELENTYWNGMIRLGAKPYRFDGEPECARKIIHCILDTVDGTDHVLIQEEIVDVLLHLPETDVGRALRSTLKDALERQKVIHERLKRWDKPEADPVLRKEYEENQKHLEATLRQIQELKIPISRRLLLFFGLTVSILNLM
jgi:hypothetical protein